MSVNKHQLLHDVVSLLSKKYAGKDLSEFLVRFGAQFGDVFAKFDRLYGYREDFSNRFSELILALAEMHLARDPELRDLDRQREEDKDWIMSPNWVATMLYVDRFSKNLKGFMQKIDYLEELGVNYVHLMPLLKMPQEANDGGYAVSDYRTVEKRFGSMADIRKIAKTFRAKNMLLELDLVLNHTSNEHEWAKKALQGEKEYQDMYYMYDDRSMPDAFEQTLPEIFPENAPGNFTYLPAINKWVFTVFNTYQWDLNYTNPKVFIEMIKILLNLANQGVDVLRLDAVAFMWKKLGTQSQNLEEAHILLQLFKACTKIAAPGAIFKAEAIVQPVEIVKYLGGGTVDECEIAYNASYMVYLWDAMATQNKRILEHGLQNIPRLPKGTTWINYIRCHDDIGLGYADQDILAAGYNPFDHKQFMISYYVGEFEGSPAKGQRFMYNPKTKDARITGATATLLGLEKGLEESNAELTELAVRKILLMHSGIMSFGGIPLVYYGDELACTNDYSFLEDPSKQDDNRWLNRPIIDWKKAAKRNQPGTIEHRVFSALKQMIALRKSIPEFYNENDYQLVKNDNPHVFSFLRTRDWHKTLVLMNVSSQPQTVYQTVLEQTGFGHYVYDQYQQQDVALENGALTLEPFQFLWLKQK
ncbi:alpha amylase catalytic region [Tolumonas auensis DSM 9187]|uniref:Alpha amylase catalytic region n=1 Tax=Tolumonas auensis (strain DSM 9187 / NBRC 110442 / TA 4) TaxID=595494 RepID=C4LED8_TOLAT|nr:amylosucrase [Tolumonas auensis]ACQ92955.1 alpha amylase catalytic region [Tolumonas auensis DSM 9187]